MPNTDKSRIMLDLAVAFALLTRLPLTRLPDSAFDDQARASWAFAPVGAFVGAVAGGVGWLAVWAGLPFGAAAGLVVLAQVMVSGAMHEDGLADTADGLWGTTSRWRRLEIMRDSRIGTYGVLALILSIMLRWVAIGVLLEGGPVAAMVALILAGALSRACLPIVMAALPHARTDGLSRQVGRPGPVGPGGAAAVTVVLAMAAGGIWALVPVGLAFAGAAFVAGVARVKIGGQTGDILGACQQVAEIAALLGFTMVLGR